jgi:predicted RNA-binding Zn ribbon-like protein
MSGTKTVETMSLLGGHPVLDFVNTVDSRIGREGPDYLNSYGDLLTFAERIALADPETLAAARQAAAEDPDAAEAALARARRLREALYRICRSESTDEAVPAEDTALLEAAIRSALGKRRLSAGPSGLAWTFPPVEDLDAVSDRIAIAALDLLLDGKAARRPIRECPGRNCGWLFIDSSRGGRRRWCSDSTCGTGARVRKFRAV